MLTQGNTQEGLEWSQQIADDCCLGLPIIRRQDSAWWPDVSTTVPLFLTVEQSLPSGKKHSAICKSLQGQWRSCLSANHSWRPVGNSKYTVNWYSTKVHKQIKEKGVFSINGPGKTGYSYVKQWTSTHTLNETFCPFPPATVENLVLHRDVR